MADSKQAGGSRPSFTSFWKKGKAKLKGKDITFVGQGGASSPADDQAAQENAQSQKDKAQARRAQVRKAQIQHRQRKANYVRELELDVAKFRELIAQVEREGALLLKENEGIKSALVNAGIDPSLQQKPQLYTQSPGPLPQYQSGDLSGQVGAQYTDPLALQLEQQNLQDYGSYPAAEQSPEMFADIDIDDLTVTLGVDETMGTPCLQISSNSSGVSIHTASSPRSEIGSPPMTAAQEQTAVNFILALEHGCWNHFGLEACPDFVGADDDDAQNGHILMASAYCMNTAPANIYEDGARLAQPHRHAAPASVKWQGSAGGLTLESLHGLARSLNPGDLDVTPVQAWFELAERYGTGRLLAALDVLKAEFNGMVNCVFFGATIERQAFESVVGRVLGPP